MSWFGADPAAELDVKIEEATSESIPNGEMDMAVAMEITDVIRSKKVPPKQAMRGLKKRLTKVYANPNTLAAVLKLTDVCVKNGGSHFLVEINSKEFIDYLVEYIFKVHYDTKNYKVYSSEAKHAIGTQILRLVKEWSMYFQDKFQGNYLGKVYQNLTNQGYEFPAVDTPIQGNASNFIDSATPPDWVDGRECMICYNPFSVMNRKHHCRACGGVFCQTHSSNNIPLVSLGILQPVRVCDDCFQIHKNTTGRGERQTETGVKSRGISDAPDEDEELKRAIELSLQDTGVPVAFSERPSSPPPGHVARNNDDDDDDDMKAAIAASLAEFKQTQTQRTPEAAQAAQVQKVQEPESDFYSNIMPINASAYTGQTVDSAYGSSNARVENPFAQSQGQWSQNQGPQYQQTQNQPIQNQHTQQQQRQVEDLSPQEEEDINLFVQLMSGIKSDPAKQANILYDQNLGELHSKVVRLKPKLNRALRASIEKYEFFLEMNNKINSITRLYDQFLDHKLNQAYNKHSISSPGSTYAQPQNTPGYNQFFVDRNQAVSHNTGPQVTGHVTGSHLPAQATGYQEPPYQHSAQGLSYQHSSASQYQASSPQQMGYQPTGPLRSGPQSPESHRIEPRESSDLNISATVPEEPFGHNPMQTTFPKLEANPSGTNSSRQENGNQLSYQAPVRQKYADSETPDNVHRQPAGASSKRRESRSSIPYPADPEPLGEDDHTKYEEEGEQNAEQDYYRNQNIPGYPAVPSSPPSDGLSDTESVASRYPALEENYEGDQENPNEGPREHASARFPSLNELNLPDLSQEPLANLKKSMTNESRKYKAEPEPLIEL